MSRKRPKRSARSVAQRPRGATGAGGTIGPFHPTPTELQPLLPVRRVGADRRGTVRTRSGTVPRGPLVRNAADGLSGFRWDVPAPDPRWTVLWASISFDWQFYSWRSLGVHNNTSNSVHVDGSLDWQWFLTGNPFVFEYAPIFLIDSGHYAFETFIVPDASGWEVGWLAPPRSDTYPSTAGDPNTPSPLSQLLAMRQGSVLRLWFAMRFTNVHVAYGGPVSGSRGWAIGDGPTTLYYTYAYAAMARPEVILQGDITTA